MINGVRDASGSQKALLGARYVPFSFRYSRKSRITVENSQQSKTNVDQEPTRVQNQSDHPDTKSKTDKEKCLKEPHYDKAGSLCQS